MSTASEGSDQAEDNTTGYVSKYWKDPQLKGRYFSLSILLFVAYVTVCIYLIVGKTDEMSVYEKGGLISACVILNIAPTFYWWLLSQRFQDWLGNTSLSPAEAEYEKERFKINSDFARATWAAFASLLLGAILKVALGK